MLKTLLSLSFLLLYFFSAYAQEINIEDFSEQNGNVYLRLRVKAAKSTRERYDVQLFSSFDGGNFQRLSVSKNDVSPDEPVTFNLSPSDLGGNGTQLQIRVEIEATTFPLTVSGDNKVKPGKQLSVRWQGYNVDGPFKVELINSFDKIMIGEENSNSLTKILDKDIDKGNYTLRVTPTRSPDSYGEMDLKVSGGVSPLLIIAPVALGGGAAAYFLLGGDDTPEEPGGLPDPPADPDNQ